MCLRQDYKEHIISILDFMVLGCLIAFAIAMLKRRASKRFVLAESGQDNVWDSSVDSDPNITVDRNANDMSTQSDSSGPTSNNNLTVPNTVELNQGLK